MRKLMLLMALLLAANVARGEGTAHPLIAQTGVTNGLCVVVGEMPAKELVALTNDGQMLVECLISDRAKADALRNEVVKTGLIGLVTIKHHPTRAALPYVSTTVNLLVSDGPVDATEVVRVVAPFGATVINGKLTKVSLPATMDEWPMVGGKADQNPHSADAQVGLPTGLRWISPQEFDNAGAAGVPSSGFRKVPFLSAAGRMATFPVDGREQSLAVFNAFNSVRLWTRPFKGNLETSNFGYFIAMDEERIYSYLDLVGPLECLDVRTGKTLWSASVGTARAPYNAARDRDNPDWIEHTRSMTNAQTVVIGERVVATKDKVLTALNAKTGAQIWSHTYPDASKILFSIKDGSVTVAVHTTVDSGNRLLKSGDGLSVLLSLDLATGKEQWKRTDLMDRGVGFVYQPPIRYKDSVLMPLKRFVDPLPGVGGSGNSPLPPGWVYVCLDSKDGTTRWRETDSGPKASLPQAWYISNCFVNQRGELWTGYSTGAVAIDAVTGKSLGKHKVSPYGTPICQLPRGVGDYMAVGRFWVNTLTKEIGSFDTVRAPCNDSVYPAYGASMAVVQGCECAKWIVGRVGMVGGPIPAPLPDDQRCETFSPLVPTTDSPGGWRSLMADGRRSSRMAGDLSEQLALAWHVRLDQPLPRGPVASDWRRDRTVRATSPAVLADGLVVVARGHQGQVVALDQATGTEKWRCQLGGRIDGPPTLWRGHAFIGCRDGWVYAIALTDGNIRWRHLVAADRRQIVNGGQLESLWPVGGSVVIEDGALYACAGISNHFDGGLWATRLDPLTGKAAWRSRVASKSRGADIRNEPMAWINGRIWMDKVSFDPASGQLIDEAAVALAGPPQTQKAPSPTQFKEMPDDRAPISTVWSRTFHGWPDRKDGPAPFPGISGTHMLINSPGVVTAHRQASARHWAFDDQGFYTAGDGGGFTRKGAAFAGTLLAYANDPKAGGKLGRIWTGSTLDHGGSAFLLTDTRIMQTTTRWISNNLPPSSLVAYTRADGKRVGKPMELPAVTAWRGIAADAGRLVLSFDDGSVGCWK